MNNISTVKECYGCGVCATVCANQIIDIQLNADGFYEPRITNATLCTDCGLCTEVCAYLRENLSCKNIPVKSYAAWSKDPAVRKKCSSGGAGFEIGCALIKKGYKICGVRYNAAKQRTEHYIATTEEEFVPSIGSKYIQSYTVDGFKAVQLKEKYLITGTPCQIGSFRRYIQKFKVEDNFVLMDFFCHDVPSMWLWLKYTKEVEKVTGKITNASWRDKSTGWHDSYVIRIDREKSIEEAGRPGSYNLQIKSKGSDYRSKLS